MKKSLIALALCALAGACTAPQPIPLAAQSRGSVAGFATLALFGTYEMELAPVYTRLAALRHRAARQSEAERISIATTIDIQALADQARRHIDAARRGSMTEPTPDQRAALAEAIRLIGRAESLLEH